MIVPENRLIVMTALFILPLSLLFTAGLDAIALAGIGCTIALSCADALLSLGRPSRFSVTVPPVVRLSKDKPGEIAINVEHPGRKERIRIGLALPLDVVSALDVQEVHLSGASPDRYPWPVTGRKRGHYPLEFLHVECKSWLGLWGLRRRIPVNAELRVYPNLAVERRSVASVFLQRGGFGIHAQRLVGKGREFEQLREYAPADSFEDIYWKGTARQGFPVTKTYQVERTQEVYVVLDCSRLSARIVEEGPGVERDSELDRFVTAALVLGLAAERQGDHFGLMAFTDRVERFIRAGGGSGHFAACRELLYTLQPRMAHPDYSEAAAFLRRRLRRRALLVFLTNVDDPVLAESFQEALQVLVRHHLVLTAMITPARIRPLFSDDVRSLDEIYAQLAGHFQWTELRALQLQLRRRGVELHTVGHRALVPELVTQYVNVKQRQSL